MISIFISFFLITLGSSSYFTLIGIAPFFQYIGYFILLAYIFASYFKNVPFRLSRVFYHALIFLLFNIGIFMQYMDMSTKIRLSFTMLVIEAVALFSENTLNNYLKINVACLAIFMSIIFSFILALITHTSLSSLAVEGIGSSQGFNGGLIHKDSFGEDFLISALGLYFCRGKTKYNNLNKYIIGIEILGIILSNARECYIWILLIAIYMLLYDLRFVNKYQKIIFISLCLIVIGGLSTIFYKFINQNSSSYAIRVQGLTNYLNMFSGNKFYMAFGNAAMAFRNSGLSYEDNIRSVTGWNGTVELPLLNILVKNGLIGLVGYVLIFSNYLIKIFLLKKSIEKKYAGAVLLLLLISTLVQNSIVSIQSIFGMMGYILFLSLWKMGKDLKE